MEQHNIRINVDASGAERGVKNLDRSMVSAVKSLDRFDSKARSTFANLAKTASTGSFSKMARDADRLSRSLASLGGVKINPSLARNLSALGAAVRAFRAPRMQSFNQLASAINRIASLRVPAALGRNLASLNSISGFRAPGQGQVRNLQQLITTLQSANPGAISSTVNALRGLNGFTVNVPRGLGRTLGQLQNFQRTMGRGAGMFSGFNTGLRGATTGLRGLENQFSATYHMATIFRTAMGGLTLGTFLKSTYDAGSAMMSFDRTIEAISVSTEEVAKHQQFLTKVTTELPIGLLEAQRSFGKFAAAARLGGTSVEDTHEIYESFSKAFAVLDLDPQKQELAFLALEQMMSKGAVQAEELRRQLGQYLPGAFELMAAAIGQTPGKLMDMMKAGQVSSKELIKLARLVTQIYEGQVPAAMAGAVAQVTMFGNLVTRTQQTIFKSGFDSGVGAMFATWTDALNNAGLEEGAKRIGAAFNDLFVWLGAAGRVAVENWEALAKVGQGLLIIAAASAAVAVMRMIISPFMWIASNAMAVAGGIWAIGTAAVTSAGGIAMLVAAAGTLVGIAASGGLDVVAEGIRNLLPKDVLDNFRQWRDEVMPWLKKFAQDDIFAKSTEAGKEKAESDIMGRITSSMKSITSSMAESITGMAGSLIDADGLKKQFEEAFKAADETSKRFQKEAHENPFDNSEFNKAHQERMAKMKEEEINLTKKQQALLDQLDPIRKANEDYKEQIKLLDMLKEKSVENGGITAKQYDELKSRLDRLKMEDLNPFGAMVRDMEEEFAVLKKVGDEREIEQKVLAERNRLLKAGVTVTEEMANAMRDLYKAQMDLERGGSNGFQRWASSTKDFREALIDVETNAVSSLSDSLTDLVTEGQADFAALGKSILRSLNKALIDSIMKDIFSGFSGNSPLASLFGLKAPNADSALAKAKALIPGAGESVASMAVQAGAVYINGAPLGMAAPNMSANGRVDNAFRATAPNEGQAQKLGTLPGVGQQTPAQSDFGSAGNIGRLPSIAGVTPGPTPADRVHGAWGAFGVAKSAPSASFSATHSASGLGPVMPLSGNTLQLSTQDITDLKKTLATEWVTSAGEDQGKGIIDTILNRQASGKWGTTTASVVNARSQFSDINGRPAWQKGRNSVDDLPDDMLLSGRGLKSSQLVDKYLAERAAGAPSMVGDNLNYANPHFSDARNLGWINKLEGPVLGRGNAIHRHGTTPDLESARPGAYGIQLPGQGAPMPGQMTAPGMSGFGQMNVSGLGEQFKAQMQPAMQQTATGFTTAMQPATQQTASSFSTSMMPATQQAAQQLPQAMTGATSQVASNFTTQMNGATSQVAANMNSQMASANGGWAQAANGANMAANAAGQAGMGLGGLIGPLGQIIQMASGGGGGGIGSIFGMLGGMFKEGGLSTHPVAVGAVGHSYASGTARAKRAPGTKSVNGGFPATLHDNEAVIPLSRGRKVPVEMSQDNDKNLDSGSGGGMIVNINGVKDVDSFNKSKSQVQASLAAMQQRAAQKNN